MRHEQRDGDIELVLDDPDWLTEVGIAFSTLKDKEQAYQRLNLMLERREIVIPDDGELLRQMGGVSASPIPSGGMHIEARLESIHDDLPDALALAVSKLPAQLPEVAAMPVPCGVTWTEIPAQVKIPVPFVTLRPELAYDGLNGELRTCGNCGFRIRVAGPDCKYCREPNPEYTAAARKPAPVGASADADRPAVNWMMSDPWKCPDPSHLPYDRKRFDRCPKCDPGAGGSPMSRRGPFPGGGMPPGLASRLGPFLGPGR